MVERKYLAHYVDAAFDLTYEAPNYVRLGDDLEEYNEELNPDVETKVNIIGETTVKNKGYQPQADVDPFYNSYNEALSTKLEEIVNKRLTGDACKTSVVDVLMQAPATEGGTPTTVWAYREDAMIIVNTFGGDTSGVQTQFSINKCGNRVRGTWDYSTKAFTPISA